MKSQSFEQLIVWQKAHSYVLAIYKITKQYPKEELFCLVNQMRRAAASITANIAEGYAKRESQEELKRFLMMALGSSNEVLVLIDFSKDVGYISDEKHRKAFAEYEEIASMLNSFIQSAKTKV